MAVKYVYTAKSDYINAMKTTFDFNFDIDQAVMTREAVNLKSFSLIPCKLVNLLTIKL